MASIRTESSDEDERVSVINILDAPLPGNPSLNTAGSSLLRDPSVNTVKLPHDHPVHLLAAARSHYGNSIQPPFTLHRRGSHGEAPREVMIPTVLGGRARKPTIAKSIARAWDEKLYFWTLDCNGLRFIVKSFPGAQLGGAKYYPWKGPIAGFNDEHEKPMAYSSINMELAIGRYRQAWEDYQGVKVPAGIHGTTLLQRSRKHRRRSSTPSLSHNRFPLRGEASKAVAPEDNELGSQLRSPLQPVIDNPSQDRAAVQPGTKNALPKGIKPAWSSDHYRSVAARNTDQAAHTSSSAPAKQRRIEAPIRELADLGSGSPSASHGSTSQRHSLAGPVAQAERPQQPIALPTTLSLAKQYRTILCIRMVSSAEYRPLKLTDCPTLSAFFDRVLGAWNVQSSGVDKVTATFAWMPVDDIMRKFVMDSDSEACWIHLMEQVNEAPCWDNKEGNGKCVLDMEIVTRNKSVRK